MRKILHIITGLNDGGAEAVLYRICINDINNKHIVVSMMDEGKYGPLLIKAGIELHCLNARRGRISYTHIKRLWIIIRHIRPNVVQTWMYHANFVGGVVSYFAGARKIIWSLRHVHLLASDSKITTRIVDKISATLSYFIPTTIIAISNSVLQSHVERGYASKFVIIYNGCDIHSFRPDRHNRDKLIRHFRLNARLPIIGCIARWTPEKDHETLLRAVALALRECKFQTILVGTGCTYDNDILFKIIDKLDLRNYVFAIGPQSNIPEIMNLLDIHVLPSKNEAFGNVLIEAMACGTPCISTNVGDAVHIVGNTGWIVDREDPEMLARSIISAITAMKDHSVRKHQSVASRRRVIDEFSVERMIAEYRLVWGS